MGFTVLALTLFGSGAALAGINQWTSNGPSGVAVQSIAIDPIASATVYAGTTGSGVFKSTNRGGNWSQINTGLINLNIQALSIDPSSTDTLYAGTTGGIYKSVNSGDSWYPINVGLTSSAITALAIDPITPTIIYAGTSGGGVFKSTNSGGSWAQINTGFTDDYSSYVRALAIDKSNSNVIYAGVYNGVFKSTNSGGSWSRTGTGITYSDILSLAIDPTSPNTVYVGTFGGLYRSINGGESWSEVYISSSVVHVNSIVIDPASTTIYLGTSAGVLKSAPGQSYWSWMALSFPVINALVFDPTFPSTLYAGSSDNGVNVWTIAPSISVSPSPVDLGTVNVATTSAARPITVGNTGAVNVQVSSFNVNSADGPTFHLDYGNGSGGTCGATPTIAPEGHCTVNVTFAPSSAGSKSGTLEVRSNDPSSPYIAVPLKGTGGDNITNVSPPGGTYTLPQRITLTATRPASIYYTIDGTDPVASPSRQTYAEPISISATTVLKFYGVDTSGDAETVQTVAYSIFDLSNLSFVFGGNASWFLQSNVSHDGIDAYQSGAIANQQSSWMETQVTGPGVIRFWWKTSSVWGRYLWFYVDGISQMYISGERSWEPVSYAISAGNHSLRWTYSTNTSQPSGFDAGWVDLVAFESGSNLDIYGPATTATPPSGSYASVQSVTLTCKDSGSGCANTFYCLGNNCTPANPYNGGSIAISAPTDLRFYSTDMAGNSAGVKTATYMFDYSPPTTTVNPSSGTFEAKAEIYFSCTDGGNGSGCDRTYYCLGSGCTPETLAASVSGHITVTASTDLRFFSIDKAGNSEGVKTASFTITPDTAPPTSSIGPPGGTYNSIQCVFLSCNDSGSGCDKTYYCLGQDCQPSKIYNGGITIYASTDVRYYSQDKAGHSDAIRTATYTIVDNTPPVTAPTSAGGSYAAPLRTAFTCRDGLGSGCARTYYCLGSDCSPTTPYIDPIVISATTDLRFYSTDMAGNNEAVKTATYTLSSAQGSIIKVPGAKQSIQAAIDAAANGDTVLVSPGTYLENVNFNGKAVAVVSSGGPDVTIIDGNQAGATVTFRSSEGPSSVLSGFTVRNGNAGYTYPSYGDGGGIYIYYASPTVLNNKITGNVADDGGGIYVGFGSPIIQGNSITTNSGGGISILGWGAAQIMDNLISDNKNSSDGGGINLWAAGTPTIQRNTIRNNSSYRAGGGISMVNESDALIVQNVITGNKLTGTVSMGGGKGGGVYWLVANGDRGPTLVNNTIAGNDGEQGSGVFADGSDYKALLINNIIVGKAGQTAIYCGNFNAIYPPQLSHNLVYAPSGSTYSGICTDQNGVNGNISADPQMSNVTLGYHGLQLGSPAIDAGDNSAPALPATDADGSPRIVAGIPQGSVRVDIGAYEYDPNEPRAVLTDPPSGTTTLTTATIIVGGAEMASYRYALDGGPFTTADTPVSTPIILTGLANGTHAVAVIGKTLTREQPVSSATVAEWTIDTTPPVTTATPASGTYASAQNVTLACNDGTGSGCTTTRYCLGSGCTPDITYNGPIAVTPPTELRFTSQDSIGNQEPIKTAMYISVGMISGMVTDSISGAGIQGVFVDAYDASKGLWTGYGSTDATGAYVVSGLATGSYKLRFSSPYNAGYITQWYNNKNNISSATIVTVAAPNVTTGIDMSLTKGGSITGKVTDSVSGNGILQAYVTAYDTVTGNRVSYGNTDATGAYTISGLATGSYKLRFTSPYNAGYITQWYNNKADLTSATAVPVSAPGTTSGIDVALVKGARITGKITDSSNGAVIQGARVSVYDAASGSWIGDAYTDATGTYTVTGLASGNYKVRFTGSSGTASPSIPAPSPASPAPPAAGGYISLSSTSNTGYLSQWYSGKTDQSSANIVTVTAPGTTGGIDAALTKGGAITGKVTDSTSGAGIQGVYVYVYDAGSGGSVGYGSTDAAGAYTISGLATGSYKLRFSGPYNAGYIGQWYNNKADQTSVTAVQVTAPDTTTGIDVAMVKGGSITGRITDSVTGAGILGIFTGVYDATTGAWVNCSYMIDTSGVYTITGLASGSYKLRFSGSSSSGYIGQWYGNKADQASATTITVTAPATTSGIDVAMAKGGSISGRVTDSLTGGPVTGAYLEAIDRSTGDSAANASTDQNGAYTLTGLSTGSYVLRVDASQSSYQGGWYNGKDGYLCADQVSVTAPDTTTGIDLSLDKGGSISGRVTDAATGEGVGNVRVTYYRQLSGTTIGVVHAGTNPVTDPTGAYTINGLESGTYRITFSGTGYVSTSSTVQVTAPDSVTNADAALARGGSISGRVTDNIGGGIYGVVVQAIDPVTGSWLKGDNSDENGDYSITGLPNGSYRLFFDGRYNGGYLSDWLKDPVDPSIARLVSVAAPADTGGIDMTLARGGAISGRVTDSLTGAPLPYISVQATDGNGSNGSYFTGSDGTYTINGLPSGSYKVQFMGGWDNYLNRWYRDSADAAGAAAVVVTVPETTGGIDGTLVKGGSISGTIAVSSCPGPRMVRVNAYDAVSGKLAGQTIVDTAYGDHFTMRLPAGSYKLEFDAGDSGFIRTWYNGKGDQASADPVQVVAPDATTGLQVLLTPGGGSIAGTATDGSGQPVMLTIKAYDWYSGNFVGQTTTGHGSSYTLHGLPSGSYKLLFTGNKSYAGTWYKDAADASRPAMVVVSGTTPVTGIDLVAENAPDGVLVGNDGLPEIADALMTLRIVVGLTPLSPEYLRHGDVAPAVEGISIPDGKLDIGDTMLILRKVVGLPW
jgi:hypothetical protein